MSDYNWAGTKVGHNIHVLLDVAEDLAKGFYGNAHERRFISASKAELEMAIAAIGTMLAQINAADTSQRVAFCGQVYIPHQGYREG